MDNLQKPQEMLAILFLTLKSSTQKGPHRSLLPASIHCVFVQSLMGFLPHLTAQFLGCQQALPWAEDIAQPSYHSWKTQIPKSGPWD